MLGPAATRLCCWPRRATWRSPTVSRRGQAGTRWPNRATPARARGRGGRRRGAGATAPRLAAREARGGLAAQSARLCVSAHRGGARVRSDDADVPAILVPICHAKPETARQVRQRIGAVMKWAVAMGYRPDNPAGDALGHAVGRQGAVVQHMPALPHGAVPDALATVRTSLALVTIKDAFELLVLTAARSGEVRLATWDEMDLDAGVWTIPAARMKAKWDHRVPLSGRALAILHDARRRSDGTGLVFRSPRGKPLSDMTLSKLIKELGIAAVPHGFRSSFRDWAAEYTNTPREVVEAALAHTVRNPTEAAYARRDLFERRRRLMDNRSAYLRRARGPVMF